MAGENPAQVGKQLSPLPSTVPLLLVSGDGGEEQEGIPIRSAAR